jgi:uncharacterized protein
MLLIFLAIGALAGILSGMFGIGGGIIIVPALMLVAGMPVIKATGTSLVALLLPVGALGAWEYYRNGNLDVRAALLLAAGLFVGAWFGARLAHSVSPFFLKRGFAVLLVFVAARLWITAR